MQKQLILVDSLTKQPIDSTGEYLTRASDRITIERGQWSVLCFQLYDRTVDENGAIVLTPTDLSGNTFILVADSDFKDDNSLMFKSFQSLTPFDSSDPESNCFNIAGDWYDGGDADVTQGQVSVRINTNTAKFTQVVDESLSYAPCYINLKIKTLSIDDWSTTAWIEFVASNTVKDWCSTQVNPPTGQVAEQAMSTYFANALEFQYSSIDSGNWSSTYTASSDRYMRMRIANIEAPWSQPMELPSIRFTDSMIIPFSVTSVPTTLSFIKGVELPFINEGLPEFDVIDSTGLNITANPFLSRGWVDSSTYNVAVTEDFPLGEYTLKFAGIEGEGGGGGGGGVTPAYVSAAISAHNNNQSAHSGTFDAAGTASTAVSDHNSNQSAHTGLFDSAGAANSAVATHDASVAAHIEKYRPIVVEQDQYGDVTITWSPDRIYYTDLTDDGIIYLSEAASSISSYERIETFELHVHVSNANTSWSIATGSTDIWADDDNVFASGGASPPSMIDGSRTYVITVRYVSSLSAYLFNLAYTLVDFS